VSQGFLIPIILANPADFSY